MPVTSPPRPLPLFPLPNVVLFPTGSVPLYIFEPRYRAMVRTALDGDRRIGMVAIRPDALNDSGENPAVFDVGCEGEISGAREREDGTLDILLMAKHRFRILSESLPTPVRPYRMAEVEYLAEQSDPKSASALGPLRADLLSALEELVARQHRKMTVEAKDQMAAFQVKLKDFTEAELVHVVAQAIELGVVEKQRLLEAPGTRARHELLIELLRFQIAESGIPVAPGSGVLQ
ncbi:MAG: LON peptidase substrate-binding domain-containing protein [Myxococcota bacterium]|jgi:uncharacterized protein|nr:LON peptidase substrate-binding domain-containing protein [Myxococcota bacterium]